MESPEKDVKNATKIKAKSGQYKIKTKEIKVLVEADKQIQKNTEKQLGNGENQIFNTMLLERLHTEQENKIKPLLGQI